MSKAMMSFPATSPGSLDVMSANLAAFLDAAGLTKVDVTGEVRTLADSLNDQDPVYIKFVPTYTTYYFYTISVGHQVDSSGNLIGPSIGPFNIGRSSGTATVNIISHGEGYLSFAFGADAAPNTNGSAAVYISRLNNNNGEPVPNGVNVGYIGGIASYKSGWQYLPSNTSGGAPYPSSMMATPMCAAPGSSRSIMDRRVGLYPVLPNLGYPGNPDMGGIIYYHDEFNCGFTYTVNYMNGTHDYFFVPCSSNAGVSLNGSTSYKWGLAIRYE